MPLVPFAAMMEDARRGGYAVGYFESWNLESLLAVANAAERLQSPVILGFSGITLPHPARLAPDPLEAYAAMALAVCRRMSAPAVLLFNECPYEDWVFDAADAGFNLVMYAEEAGAPAGAAARVGRIAAALRKRGVAVEAEPAPLPGVAGDLREEPPSGLEMTDPDEAARFLEDTRVDALAVNVGQVHLHGRRQVRLDLDRLRRLSSLPTPLVLHGASSVEPADLTAAIRIGVSKINVGSRLKQAFFASLRRSAIEAGDTPGNPYEVIGSGLAADALMAGRLAMQKEVERFMILFGSDGKAARA